MALIDIGDISVDMTVQTLNPFALVPVAPGNGYIFILQPSPVTATLEFGYFVVIPYLSIGSQFASVGSGFKWYPRSTPCSFTVPVYAGLPTTTQATVAVVPIEIFRGRASPTSYNLNLTYEDSLLQPLGFGVP